MTLAALKRRINAGTLLRCSAHWRDAARPDEPPQAGTVRTVTKVQGNGYYYTVAGRRERLWAPWPKARDLTFASDGGTFTVHYPGKGDVTLSLVQPGHVILNIRIDVHDAAAFVQAGRRSYARDLATWTPGMPVPDLPGDAAAVIPDPAHAAADLLVEAFARCYMPHSNKLVEDLAAVAEFGDIHDKAWYPAGDSGDDL